MKSASKLLAVIGCGALIATSACTTDPVSGERRISNAAIGGIGGALGGYLLGDIVGGRRDRTEKIVGAGIGAYMDRQERDLRARTAGTDVRVVRQGDDLLLNIPSGINFAYNDATVAPQFQRTLDRVAGVLGDYERTYVDVYGHTDSTGGDAFNQDLSQRRAVSVAQYLESRGVRRARFGTRGYGETQPLASNETPEGQAANRRVEIKIVPISQNETGPG